MSKIKVTLVRGLCRTTKRQKANLRGLGLSKKINNSSLLESSPCILGMIKKVSHLIKVEEV